jgi:hypothetical protein
MSRFNSKQHLKKMADWITGLDITEERQERRKKETNAEDEKTSTSGSGADRTHGLPWEPRSAAEVPLERALRSRILKLSTDEKVFLTDYRDSELMDAQEAIERAEQCLKLDENLRKQRFVCVSVWYFFERKSCLQTHSHFMHASCFAFPIPLSLNT